METNIAKIWAKNRRSCGVWKVSCLLSCVRDMLIIIAALSTFLCLLTCITL